MIFRRDVLKYKKIEHLLPYVVNVLYILTRCSSDGTGTCFSRCCVRVA